MKRQIASEFGVDVGPAEIPAVSSGAGRKRSRQAPAPAVAEAPAAAAPGAPAPHANAVLDLNSASEEDIATLPGIGIILAKKAVQYRLTRSAGFRHVDEFMEELDLKPHVAERVRPLITVRPVAPTPPPPTGGRVVDY